MFIYPKPTLRTVIIGNVQSVLDVHDAKFVQSKLPEGTVKVRPYGHYTKQTKVGHQPSSCIDITEQYKREYGYA